MAMLAARAIASLGWILAASRSLGVAQVGELAAISAMTSLTAVVASGGISYALTSVCARRPDTARRTLMVAERAFAATAGVSCAVCLGLALVGRSVSPWALLIMFVSDVVIAGRLDLAGSAFVGIGRFSVAAQLSVVWAVGRVVAGAIVVWGGIGSLVGATIVAAACAAPTFLIVSLVSRRLPAVAPAEVNHRQLVRASMPFALGGVVGRGTNDADKIILNAKLSPRPEVGTYAIAYRIVDFALLPLVSISAAVYPRMFRAGAGGLDSARKLARRVRAVYVGIGLLVSLVVVCATPLATKLFGDQYTGLGTMMLSLAPLSMVRVVSMLLGEPLSGSDRQTWRVAAGAVALATNVAVNLAFVADYGWKAAVAATYASELVLIGALAVMHRSIDAAGRRRVAGDRS
jgi:O-antigen/teichoic acid export membrane protein